jgi:hypothetical protein
LYSPPDLALHLDKCVIVEGNSGGRKLGPELRSGDAHVGVAFSDAGREDMWNELPGGARVRVRGVVRGRSDLPVFEARDGELPHAGIPVPEGTDLEAARRRLVIEGAEFTLLRGPEQVEHEMHAQLGTEIALQGFLWSLNGHWWFNHDGLDIHLDNREAIANWDSLHGRAVMLQGTLERKPMPRIDQLTLTAEPERTDAFVITIAAVAPASPSEVLGCETKD